MTNTAPHLRRGFTLVEMVLSMAVMTVLLGGIASAMILASRALPNLATPLTNSVEGYHAADRVAGELYAAQSFTIMSPTDVQFTVDDRNNDGAPDTIRYTWSGIAGAPLKQQYNSDAAAVIVDNVYEFALTYDRLQVTQTQPGAPTESAETLLISFDSTSGLGNNSINSNNWVGQYFKPALQADATAWKITRVKIQASAHGDNKGVNWVQLRLPTGSFLPGSAILEQAAMPESNLTGTPSWQQLSYSSASGLSPSQGMCLVVAFASTAGDADTADISKSSSGAQSNSNFVKTSNAGSSWSATTESLLYYVYGTVTAPAKPQTLHLYYLMDVQIKLRVGNDTGARVQTTVQVLNQPEVTGL